MKMNRLILRYKHICISIFPPLTLNIFKDIVQLMSVSVIGGEERSDNFKISYSDGTNRNKNNKLEYRKPFDHYIYFKRCWHMCFMNHCVRIEFSTARTVP